MVNARINNLESNLHIEIDMERIEDRSKALSYIGIEVADALKVIPAPAEDIKNVVQESVNEVGVQQATNTYMEETRVEVKPSLWSRIKNSKFVRTIKCLMKVKIRLDVPVLPEGKGE